MRSSVESAVTTSSGTFGAPSGSFAAPYALGTFGAPSGTFGASSSGTFGAPSGTLAATTGTCALVADHELEVPSVVAGASDSSD